MCYKIVMKRGRTLWYAFKEQNQKSKGVSSHEQNSTRSGLPSSRSPVCRTARPITGSHHRVSRMTVYRWRKRYDGTKESLVPRSRRPHHHPNQHTKAEDALIRNMRRRRPHDGLVVFWVRLRLRGCTRSITGLYRHMRRMKLYAEKLPNPKYIPKPYKPASFPGETVQIDVKVVPKSCIAGKALDEGLRLCQYTAIDECTRLRCLGAFEEQSTFSSAQFLQQLVDAFPFPIRKVQTDGGTEFTKRFTKGSGHDETLF